MEILLYDNDKHRDAVINIWKNIFGYKEKRNSPELAIDNKLSANDKLFFVAVENSIVIGTIMAGYDGHRGWIYSLAVTPEKRKKNVGSKLLSHAENELRKRGCIKINLQVLKSNEGVTAFYKKNGYAVEERISMGKEITENVK